MLAWVLVVLVHVMGLADICKARVGVLTVCQDWAQWGSWGHKGLQGELQLQ